MYDATSMTQSEKLRLLIMDCLAEKPMTTEIAQSTKACRRRQRTKLMGFILAFDAHPLVHLNAGLNVLATVLLLVGYFLIKCGSRRAHGWVMLAAFVVSCLFLMSYLTYHWTVGRCEVHPPWRRKGHLSCDLVVTRVAGGEVPFLAAVSISYAILGNGFHSAGELPSEQQLNYLARHRRLSKWTFPIWLYVSVTGVVVYVMLYHPLQKCSVN